MADGCYYEEDKKSIQKIFTENFLDRYTKDKTPFPLFFHSAWFFNRPHRAEAFFAFIGKSNFQFNISPLDDVNLKLADLVFF